MLFLLPLILILFMALSLLVSLVLLAVLLLVFLLDLMLVMPLLLLLVLLLPLPIPLVVLLVLLLLLLLLLLLQLLLLLWSLLPLLDRRNVASNIPNTPTDTAGVAHTGVSASERRTSLNKATDCPVRVASTALAKGQSCSVWLLLRLLTRRGYRRLECEEGGA